MKRQRYHAGRWAVQRERFRIAAREPPAPVQEARSIGQVLSGLLDRMGVERDDRLGTIEQEWATLVGAGIAAHTRPGRLSRGCLTVYVDSPVWMQELSGPPSILMREKAQERFGSDAVRELRLQIDPGTPSSGGS